MERKYIAKGFYKMEEWVAKLVIDTNYNLQVASVV